MYIDESGKKSYESEKIEYDLPNTFKGGIKHIGKTIRNRLIDEEFGGVPKEKIIELLKKHYPENFV